MIRGRFGDTSGAPYIDGRIIIKQFKIYAWISFLIDTGSDYTVLLPTDSNNLSINCAQIKDKTISCALNGNCELYSLPAIIQFIENNIRVYSYDITLKIAHPNPEIETLPSIVGRNVLDNWAINYCRSKNRLNIKILSADRVTNYEPTP